MVDKKIEKVKENVIKESSNNIKEIFPEIELKEVKGHNLDKKLTIKDFLSGLENIGFQATEIAKAAKIWQDMYREKAKIILAFTSNIISSGLREYVKWLVKNRKVDAIITTAGGVEEDLIKCLEPFYVAEFEMPDRKLREHAINRIGNILCPSNGYVKFEKFMMKMFDKAWEKQSKEIISSSEFIEMLGKAIEDESSYLFWAAKNNIKVFCPALTDGSIGDMLYFYRKYKARDLKIDIAKDIEILNDFSIEAEKLGLVVVGGSLPKHHAINAALFRGGADFAIYITTATKYDGSLSGADASEAVSWGKLKFNASHREIHLEASVAFPLLVLKTFEKELLG